MPGSFEPTHPELLLPWTSREKSRLFSDASNLITLLKIKLTTNQREQLLEGDYKNVHQWVMHRFMLIHYFSEMSMTQSKSLSLSWPYDSHRLTIFPESHTKNTQLSRGIGIISPHHDMYGCHVIISLVFFFFYLRCSLERARIRGAKTNEILFCPHHERFWCLSLPDSFIINVSG